MTTNTICLVLAGVCFGVAATSAAVVIGTKLGELERRRRELKRVGRRLVRQMRPKVIDFEAYWLDLREEAR